VPGEALERRESAARWRSIAQGTLSALAMRGIGAMAGLAAVPITVGYLGPERYGVWMTIAATLAWLSLSDLGVLNELTNVLAAARASGDTARARAAVSTALLAVAAVTLSLLVVGAATFRLVNWPGLLGVAPGQAATETAPAVAVAVALFLVELPLGVVGRVYVTQREGGEGNAWEAVAALASLGAVLGVTRGSGGLPALVVAWSGSRVLVLLASAAWLFGFRHPELRPRLGFFRVDMVRGLLGRGGAFFLAQAAALVLFSTDNIIIARVLGPAAVTPYSVTWRLFGISTLLVSLAFPYLWAAHADALARQDREWVVAALRRSVGAALLAAVVLVVPFVILGRPLIRLWAGPAAVPTGALLVWMGLWHLIHAPMTALASFLNAAGQVRVQAWAGSLSAVANVILSVFLARRFGLSGVIAATVVSYLAINAVPTLLAARRTVQSLSARPMDARRS
jgi:O-antigen/teichoic acid export membrane protein